MEPEMTAADNETLAEHAAQAHLQARHPATTGAYATHVPRHAVLLASYQTKWDITGENRELVSGHSRPRAAQGW